MISLFFLSLSSFRVTSAFLALCLSLCLYVCCSVRHFSYIHICFMDILPSPLPPPHFCTSSLIYRPVCNQVEGISLWKGRSEKDDIYAHRDQIQRHYFPRDIEKSYIFLIFTIIFRPLVFTIFHINLKYAFACLFIMNRYIALGINRMNAS